MRREGSRNARAHCVAEPRLIMQSPRLSTGSGPPPPLGHDPDHDADGADERWLPRSPQSDTRQSPAATARLTEDAVRSLPQMSHTRARSVSSSGSVWSTDQSGEDGFAFSTGYRRLTSNGSTGSRTTRSVRSGTDHRVRADSHAATDRTHSSESPRSDSQTQSSEPAPTMRTSSTATTPTSRRSSSGQWSDAELRSPFFLEIRESPSCLGVLLCEYQDSDAGTDEPRALGQARVVGHFPEHPTWIPQNVEQFVFPEAGTQLDAVESPDAAKRGSPRTRFHTFALLGAGVNYFGAVCRWPNAIGGAEDASLGWTGLCVLGVSPVVDFSLQVLRRLAASTAWVGGHARPTRDLNTTAVGMVEETHHTITNFELQSFLHRYRTEVQRFTLQMPQMPSASGVDDSKALAAPPFHLLPCIDVDIAAAFHGVTASDLVTLYMAVFHGCRVVISGKNQTRVRQ